MLFFPFPFSLHAGYYANLVVLPSLHSWCCVLYIFMSPHTRALFSPSIFLHAGYYANLVVLASLWLAPASVIAERTAFAIANGPLLGAVGGDRGGGE